MAVLAGLAIVLGAIALGFTMAGGRIASLLHLSEFITIGGAAFGALIIMSPKKVLMDVIRSTLQVVKGTPYHKATCIETCELLADLARLMRRDGILALDSHIASPHESSLFQKYPRVYGNHHAIDFLCTGLTMIVDGKAQADQLTAALAEEVKVIEREHHAAVGVLQKTADALPGFGIVAAVLGIVVTMGAIEGPASEIGHKVGTALVGTFLGILLSYGFFGPLSSRMELLGEAEMNYFRCISTAIVALSEGGSPTDVVIRARRAIGTDCRPSPEEMAKILKGAAA
jgi:chemotaxis protein MotA